MQILDDPIPTGANTPFVKSPMDVGEWQVLPKPVNIEDVGLLTVLERRKTRRDFKSLELTQIATLLWYSQRRLQVRRDNSDIMKSPIPTAGGLGGVRTIVVSAKNTPWVYDPLSHRAEMLDVSSTSITRVVDEAEAFMPMGDGWLLVFVAFREYLEHYYAHPESLVLREAGVLVGTLALLSELLEHSFCPLGTQAHNWASDLLGLRKELIIPAGAAIVGGRETAFVG